jgi:hypothetical protein
MIELRGREGLANETPPGIGTEEHLRARDLESNIAFELRIKRQENDAAPALTQLPTKFEPTDAMSPAGRSGCGGREVSCPGRNHAAGVRQNLTDRTFIYSRLTQRLDRTLPRKRGSRRELGPRYADGRSFSIPSIDTLVVGCKQPREVLINLKRVGRVHQPHEVNRTAGIGP